MSKYHLNDLEQLEAESIYIMREVAAQFDKPALLFSGGKDSITLVHLAMKAFAPMKIPFPLVHIDTGHNFPEALAYRDYLAKEIGAELIVRKVEDTIHKQNLTEPKGKFASRNWLQTHTLLETIEEFQFDACIGGARRDEEKARAKERFFSVRDDFGKWDPKLLREAASFGATQLVINVAALVYLRTDPIVVNLVLKDTMQVSYYGIALKISETLYLLTKQVVNVLSPYVAELKGKDLLLNLGFSHPVNFPAPDGIAYDVDAKARLIKIKGRDRQQVGQIAANIRMLRPPERYHGTGIRYQGEIIKLKAGKAGKTGK